MVEYRTTPSQPLALRPSARGLSLPFVNTSPVVDVAILFLLLPVWWAMGIEQFVWPVGLSWVGWKVLVSKRFTISRVPTLGWLFAFLLVHLVSGLFIDEAFRWLTFIRNFGTYLAGFNLVLILTNRVRSWREIELLLHVAVFAMLTAAGLGLLGILGWQPRFTSLAGLLLPEWIKATEYGGLIAFRATGQESWFRGLGRYFRVNSLFMFATLYASAIAVSLPICVYLMSQSRGLLKKLAWAAGTALLVVNLFYTTARMAMLGLLSGALFYLVFFSRLRGIFKALLAAAILAALAAVFIVASSSTFPLPLVKAAAEAMIYARGAGSIASRLFVYKWTVEEALLRPFFGWGTERDIPGFRFPAGSHSYYLGILYKQGAVGLLAFVGTWLALLKDTLPPRDEAAHDAASRQIAGLLRYGRWSVIAALVNSLTDVLDLDASTMAVMWLIFASLIAARRLYYSRTEAVREVG